MSLTDTVFGSPGTTTVAQAPGTKPPGYQFARDFFNSLGNITSNPFPTYQGQLDPGLSPTLQNLMRMAQGYAQSGPPEILAGVQGSLGQFMNPSYANPVARFQFGAPDYFNQDPNQTVFNGGTVNGLAGVFGQTGSSMPGTEVQGQSQMGMQGGYPQQPHTPPIYAGGQQPSYGQPGGGLQTFGPGTQDFTQGLQNAFLQNAKPLSGFPAPPPGTTQGVGGTSGTDNMMHGAGPGWSGPQWPTSWPSSAPPPGYNPNQPLTGVDPGIGWLPPGGQSFGPHPNGQFPTNPAAGGGQTYGGYTVDQLHSNPALAAQLGAHAAGLWRAFNGQGGGQPGGGPDVRPTGRHPLNPGRLPTKPTRNPATGGIAAGGGG